MSELTTPLTKALVRDKEARATFAWMGGSHRAAFNVWVQAASSEIERAQRVRAALDMLAGREPVRRN
jgi:hypothetical protein